jgi:hypothetical protein
MRERIEQATRRLGRQSDPEPPKQTPPPAPHPSLVLYAVLLAVAVALAALAFFIDPQNIKQNADGLLINLATELLGAVLILLIVEQKIRPNEARFLRTLPSTTKETVVEMLFPGVRQVKTYARVFGAQLDSVAPPFYVPVSDLESEMDANCARGFVLAGHEGKSVQLQRLANRQLPEVLRQPTRARVPVLVPVHKWQEGDAADVLRSTMRSYSNVSDRIFLRLLTAGRLMCLFDGLDDSLTPRETAERLRSFHEAYPSTPLIVSTKPTVYPLLEDLPRIEMRELSREEVERLVELRTRYADDAMD